jgi:hypothetical protein
MSAAAATAHPRTRRALRGGMLLLLLSATVLERFGISSGAASVSVALLAGYLFLALAGAAGVLSLSLTRCWLYGVCMCVGLVSLLFNESQSSVPSLWLLAAMYLPFVFVLEPGSLADTDVEGDADWVMRKFLDLTLVCALIGVAQFAAQTVIHAPWLFDFTPYIPEKLRAAGTFNTVIPVGSFNKSNGFFFREPSGFSYLMALGLIGECFGLRRKPRLVCLSLALLLTYSGTGIAALLLGSLHPFGVKTLLRLALLACLGALVFWLLGDALNLSFTLDRVAEFHSQHSSAYMRYIAPGRLVSESLDSAWWAPWFGHGPGTIFRTLRDYEFHDPTWAKLLFEYGVLGFVGVVALCLVTLRGQASSLQVRATLFWGWLILGGHLLSPEQNFLALALIGLAPSSSSRVRRSRSPSYAPNAAGVALSPAPAGGT